MNTDKLINFMKMGNIVIPLFLVRNYHKLGINADSLIILSYLLDKEGTFDYKKIGEHLNIDHKLVLDYINQLQEKGLLNIEVKKNDKGIMEERISLDLLYQKLALILIEDLNSS